MSEHAIPKTLADAEKCPVCGSFDCEHSDDERADAARRQARGEPLPDNLSDEGAIRRRQATEKKARDQAIVDLQSLMADKMFRRFMYRLLDRAHVFAPSFNPAAPNMECFLHAEGERNIGASYWQEIQTHCIDEMIAMLKENGAAR